MSDTAVAMVGRTADELRAVARGAGDAGGYFPALYSRVTAQIAASIRAGRFEDGERMARFACTFASFYTRALRGEIDPPRCWRAAWDVVDDPNLLIVQHLLLGINAHVNHDLPLAVVAVADETGDLSGVRPDFDAVNLILAETYVLILRDLDRVSRWTNEAAALGGGRLFNFSLRVARDQAWCAAQRLHPLETEGRAAYRRQLDELVSVLAYLVTRPAFPFGALLWLGRRFEQRDPRAVTAALLGET